MGKYLTYHIKEISQVFIISPYTCGDTLNALGDYQFNLELSSCLWEISAYPYLPLSQIRITLHSQSFCQLSD